MSVDLRSRHFAFRKSSCLPRKSTGLLIRQASQPIIHKKVLKLMFKPKESSQNEYEFVSIDELVPDDHLLRLMDKYVDFSYLLKKVRPFYSDDNGRPSDPLILFKMMFIGYLFGIRSERQLEKEIKMNIAYRVVLRIKIS